MTKERQEELIEKIRTEFNYLRRIPKEEQTHEVLRAAMHIHTGNFYWIKDDAMKTPEFCLMAIKNNGAMLEKIPEDRQTEEVINISLKHCPFYFAYIKDEKKKTFERCLAGVIYNSDNMKYVPEALKDKVKEAYTIHKLTESPWLLRLMDIHEQKDVYIDTAMESDPSVIKDIKDESKKTYERCEMALNHDYDLIKYIPKEIQEKLIIQF